MGSIRPPLAADFTEIPRCLKKNCYYNKFCVMESYQKEYNLLTRVALYFLVALMNVSLILSLLKPEDRFDFSSYIVIAVCFVAGPESCFLLDFTGYSNCISYLFEYQQTFHLSQIQRFTETTRLCDIQSFCLPFSHQQPKHGHKNTHFEIYYS